MTKPQSSLITDYLGALRVPHTAAYSQKRFETMPFHTLFGLKKLLEEYGVTSEGYYLADRTEILKVTPPFLVKTAGGVVVVTEISPQTITYLTEGEAETMPFADFTRAWCGNLFCSHPSATAAEPHFAAHRRMEFLNAAKKWVLALCALALFLIAFIGHGLYRQFSTVWLTAIDIAGLYLTYLLVRKSLRIHSKAADKMCGILEAHGCDRILDMKASKFFGLFGWSEVGFAYFSVSLASMLMFPESLPMLALCNVCCLPFTAWSIWYQRFRAHRWCTLCVCVQCSLWLLFFGYLGGGWIAEAWPPSVGFITLGLAYLGVMLGLNALMPLIEKKETSTENDNETSETDKAA